MSSPEASPRPSLETRGPPQDADTALLSPPSNRRNSSNISSTDTAPAKSLLQLKKKQGVVQPRDVERERVLEWSVLSPTGDKISGRYGHTACVHDRYIYFLTSKSLNTVMRFDTEQNSLQEIPTKGERPGPRSGNSAVVWDGCLYVFGGRDGNNHFDDVYQLTLSNRRWARVELSSEVRCPARYRHSSVVHNGKMYVFGGEIGGEGGHCYHDLYEFNFQRLSWKLVKTIGDHPPPRSAHSAVIHMDALTGAPILFIYGGRNKDKSQYFRDLYRCNLTTKVWTHVMNYTGEMPPATYDHAAAYYRNSFFVWGGYGSEGREMGPGTGAKRQDTLYEYSIDFNRWFLVETFGESPSARLGHTLNCIRGRLYLFGGWDRNGYCSDLSMLRLDDYMFDIRGLLLDNGHNADVVFQVEGNKTIHAHLAILHARAPALCQKVEQDGRWADSEGVGGSGGGGGEGYSSSSPFPGSRDGGGGGGGGAAVVGVVGGQHQQLQQQQPTPPAISSPNSSQGLALVKVNSGSQQQQQQQPYTKRVCHVRIPDFSYEAFFDLMMFVYTGTLQFSEKYMLDVWLLAKTYSLKRAMGLCIQAMMKNLDNSNVLFILQSAHRGRVSPIKAFCLEYIMRNYEAVATSSNIKELDSDVLVELIRLQTAAGREAVGQSKSPRRLSDLNEFEKMPEDSLRQDFLRLVGSTRYADVTFLVEQDRIPAHSCLIGRCPAFGVMFNTAFREGRDRIVELKDVSKDTFMSFLAYTYGSFVTIGSLTDALELLSLADRFLLEPLKDLCGRYITESSGTPTGLLNHHNIWTVLEIADQCRLDDLRKASVDYIARNFHAVCKSQHLKRFDAALLVEIIQRHASVCLHGPPTGGQGSTPIGSMASPALGPLGGTNTEKQGN